MSDRFKDWKPPEIIEGQPTKWNWVVQNVAGLILGANTDIGAFTYINALNGVTIEDNLQIGSHCSIYSVSTIDDKEGMVFIGENSRIGSHSIIMPGVSIGRNVVIGAFSFVTSDIPDNWLAYGIPAKPIKQMPAKLLKHIGW